MAYTYACRDFGLDCPYKPHGKTIEEAIADGRKHAKAVHGFTDKQLNDPEMIKKVKAVIKKV